MAFRVITDMKEADEYWAAGLLYCRFSDEEWFFDDSYLPIYQGPLAAWQPSRSTDEDGPLYAIQVEE